MRKPLDLSPGERLLIWEDQECNLRSFHIHPICVDVSTCPSSHFEGMPSGEPRARQRIIKKLEAK